MTRARDAGDNLVEGIKRIECVSRDTGLRMSGRVRWFRAWRNRRMRRNSQYRLTLCLERSGPGTRQFIVRVHPLIKAVRIGDHLIAKDLVVTAQPHPIAL